MSSGVGYYAQGYWATNYWDGEYWAPTGEANGDYWQGNYWNANYWNANYWALNASSPGDIVVTDDAVLSLAQFVTQVQSGPDILASTEALSLTAFQTDANIDIDISATAPNLPLSGLNLDVGTSGYILGDIDLTFSTSSTITITNGAAPGVGGLGVQGFHPTTSTPDGLDVGVGDVQQLALTNLPVNANNNVSVEPVPQALTLTAFDSPAAGIGELIEVEGVPLTFGTPTHTIIGVPIANVRATLGVIDFNTFTHTVFGRRGLFIPPGTWPPDDSIINPNADTYPSNYEICDRTGFRVERNQLVKEWTGAMVRQDSFEARNVQDFVRGVGDDLTGSPRPEQADRLIGEEYPSGVTAEDL
jgi:hypothetical protein